MKVTLGEQAPAAMPRLSRRPRSRERSPRTGWRRGRVGSTGSWDTLWKVVAVGFVVAVGLVIGSRVQDLLVLLVISVFFALAIIPAVKYMQEREP